MPDSITLDEIMSIIGDQQVTIVLQKRQIAALQKLLESTQNAVPPKES